MAAVRRPASRHEVRGAPGQSWPRILASEHHDRPLVLEQPALAVQAAAEAGQLAARADHAVAGDDDRDGVLAVGRTDRARGADVAEATSQLAVAHRRAVGDGAQGAPDAPLKRRTRRVQGKVERGTGLGEVLRQLLTDTSEDNARGTLTPCPPLYSVERGDVTGGWEVDPADPGGGGGEHP